ncbi:RHS repeat-associated protein [Streptomyces sp. SAI-144]|uniref:RHS repeat-associated core domain-containing protein n=1 Tax=Streptomyces sp. SAI-144 TaxID=2940544 RepID=UPI00247EAF9B|nr:RHS repeat-associated protein [Streptomyces sp. SAI-144]
MPVSARTSSGTRSPPVVKIQHCIHTSARTFAIGLAKRYLTPFGTNRGSGTTTWPDDKAFLGKTADADTGLSHIGAREYDPAIGQFTSMDPLLQVDILQTLNGYTYGSQNLVSHVDPGGMGLLCGKSGEPVCPTRPGGTPGNGRPNEALQPAVA